jgi:hypothetical protein
MKKHFVAIKRFSFHLPKKTLGNHHVITFVGGAGARRVEKNV